MKKRKRRGRYVSKYKNVAHRPDRQKADQPRCGLCGKTTNLTRTPCCGQWICDDEDEYVLFSFAHNSCFRNHSRYTLCGYHYTEDHPGHWQDCPECREAFRTEMYVWRGTNEYNFEKLENPPAYEPTHCSQCGRIISLSQDGYSIKGGEYFCEKCAGFDMDEALAQFKDIQ